MTAAEFARVSGIGHRQAVFKILNLGKFPSPANLVRISEATRGEVSSEDFVHEWVERQGSSSERMSA